MTTGTRESRTEAPMGIVLVHGYHGAPTDLAPLAARLGAHHGFDAVDTVCLPGHGTDVPPAFDESAFLAALAAVIDRQLVRGLHLVLLGHSTGGSLLLAEIARRLEEDPASLRTLLLLVLCATPPRIDLSYTPRWSALTADRAIGMHDIASLVSLVNRLARRTPLAVPSPVLIVHGEEDELVPVQDTEYWHRGGLATAQRHIRVAGAKHHLFTGSSAEIAMDAISRAIDDARHRQRSVLATHNQLRALYDLVPGLESFCTAWPDSQRHVHKSPAGCQALSQPFEPSGIADTEPTLANIEISTCCNLSCNACARTRLKPPARFMSREDFRRVLAHLPHAFRIVLVGLGEPLMHPEVIELVKIAVAEGRRVGLVTNGMLLNAEMAQAICASGLASITFSLDAVNQTTASLVRQGSNMQQISANIRTLIEERHRKRITLETAAFTALRSETIDEFEAIIDFAADHELDALMVTDLNFNFNHLRSVHSAFSQEVVPGLRKGLKRAMARRLPVLSVWGLEAFALTKRYMNYLLLRGEQLAHRSERRSHCASPWQSIPVNVDGNVSLCDCQPEAVIASIHRTPLSEWWNGPSMVEHRQRMLGENPPETCRVCPRF